MQCVTTTNRFSIISLDRHGIRLLAVAVDCEVLVINTRKCRLVARLEGHVGRVSAAAFAPAPGFEAVLTTVSEDRTYKVGFLCAYTPWSMASIRWAFQSHLFTI